MCPVLVGYDYDSRGIWAIEDEAKGPVQSSVQFVKGKIDDAGGSGTAVSIRSNQEESIHRQAETFMLEFTVRDSKANGAAERVVRSCVGQLRMVRHHVERRMKVSIPKDSAIMSSLVT